MVRDIYNYLILKLYYKYPYKNGKIIVDDSNVYQVLFSELDRLGGKSNLNHIDLSKVKKLSRFFSVYDDRSYFNGDISKWDVSNVQDMDYMFHNSPFNGDISNWNVENVLNMDWMFWRSSFSGDLTYWNIKNIKTMNGMFFNSPLDGKEPWWYVISPLFKGDNYSMYDSLDFGWIDLDKKVIYGDKLLKTLKRGYNKSYIGDLPKVFGFTYLNK